MNLGGNAEIDNCTFINVYASGNGGFLLFCFVKYIIGCCYFYEILWPLTTKNVIINSSIFVDNKCGGDGGSIFVGGIDSLGTSSVDFSLIIDQCLFKRCSSNSVLFYYEWFNCLFV
jgi:hypothetical protein